MSDLYDKSLFEKFDKGQLPSEPKSTNYKLHLLLAALILIGALAFVWSRFSGDSRININKASISELQRLPGVGPATAKDIVRSRPYSQIEQIKNVKGIGPKTYEKLAPRITVD